MSGAGTAPAARGPGERALAGAVIAFLLVKLGGLAINLRAFPVLRAGSWPPGTPYRTSILIPARDEETNLRRTLVLAVAQPADEVLVLDDCSSDATAAVVAEAALEHPRLALIAGRPVPDGWVGKNWACHQLAARASGDLLVFCDADVSLAPGALEALTDELDRQRADVFSVFPRQHTGSLGERMTVPLIDDVLLCLLPFPLLALPIPQAATANGQLLAFRRAAYDRLGGHAAVRSAIVEDVRLARNARHQGLKLGLALGGGLVQARMYEGYRAAVAGIGKSLLAAHGGSRALMAATATWHLVAYTVPWFRVAWLPWRVALALGLAERLGVNAKTGRRAWAETVLTPLAPLAALPIYARAARRHRTWKGRVTR